MFTERELKWTGENTLYSTWTRSGLVGPRAGLSVDLAPAIWGISTWRAFLDRYGGLGECDVWLGDEVRGVGCETACVRLRDECGQDHDECTLDCAGLVRAKVDCLRSVPDCNLSSCQIDGRGGR